VLLWALNNLDCFQLAEQTTLWKEPPQSLRVTTHLRLTERIGWNESHRCDDGLPQVWIKWNVLAGLLAAKNVTKTALILDHFYTNVYWSTKAIDRRPDYLHNFVVLVTSYICYTFVMEDMRKSTEGDGSAADIRFSIFEPEVCMLSLKQKPPKPPENCIKPCCRNDDIAQGAKSGLCVIEFKQMM